MAKYYLIAGEASGDLHGSNLIDEIIKKDLGAEFRGFGGDKMQDAGMKLSQHYKDIAYMGFKEVIMNLRTISKAMKFCKNDITDFNPDAVILIDYPGFNLRMAEFAKKAGLKVFYYISPQLWAWKEGRIKKVRAFVDKMICILPFEKDFYKKHNYEAEYVGHPLLDEIKKFKPSEEFLKTHGLENQKYIALLPGSRKQEIEKILPLIANIEKQFPDYQFVIAASKNFSEEYYRSFFKSEKIKIIYSETYNIFSFAKAGVIKSGTSTLEAGLFKLPFVVCYKTTFFTYHIFKHFAKVNYISLVNLIASKAVVRELIQHDLNESELKSELEKLTTDKDYRSRMIQEFEQIHELLGKEGASAGAAKIITQN
jgi:lipid-A-disaccharide synthase